jgi:hypothetical protein
MPKMQKTTSADRPAYLSEKQVAKRLGFSPKTLQNQSVKGQGLPYYKIFGRIRYLLDDILELERGARRSSTSEDPKWNWLAAVKAAEAAEAAANFYDKLYPASPDGMLRGHALYKMYAQIAIYHPFWAPFPSLEGSILAFLPTEFFRMAMRASIRQRQTEITAAGRDTKRWVRPLSGSRQTASDDRGGRKAAAPTRQTRYNIVIL